MDLIFDKNLIKQRRNKFAYVEDSYYFLLNEIYLRLLENIQGNFKHCLNLGSHRGELLAILERPAANSLNKINIEEIIHCDSCLPMLEQIPGLKILADEENLPFKENSFDLIISAMQLHHSNNLLKILSFLRGLLKEKGVFLAQVFGPKTLWELKLAIINAEKNNIIYPRVSPFIDVKDAGRLLQAVKFRNPVAASEIIIVNYSSPEKLFADIKYTGQANALLRQHHGLTTKAAFKKIIEEYYKICGSGRTHNGITASFEIIFLTGIK